MKLGQINRNNCKEVMIYSHRLPLLYVEGVEVTIIQVAYCNKNRVWVKDETEKAAILVSENYSIQEK